MNRLIFHRMISSGQRLKYSTTLKSQPKPNEIQHDYIGPPDKISNVRPIVRHTPEYENPVEYNLRVKRLEVEEWNQTFWTKHNKRFAEEKETFIAINKLNNHQLDNGGGDNTNCSADKMSEFYKEFLDKNWRLHFFYNLSWYLKNTELLMLALQANIIKGIRKIRS